MGYVKATHIYVLSNEFIKKGWYKVGVTHSVETRVERANTWSPADYEVEYYEKVSYPFSIEYCIHYEFCNRKEWVNGDLKEIIDRIEYYKNNEDELLRLHKKYIKDKQKESGWDAKFGVEYKRGKYEKDKSNHF